MSDRDQHQADPSARMLGGCLVWGVGGVGGLVLGVLLWVWPGWGYLWLWG